MICHGVFRAEDVFGEKVIGGEVVGVIGFCKRGVEECGGGLLLFTALTHVDFVDEDEDAFGGEEGVFEVCEFLEGSGDDFVASVNEVDEVFGGGGCVGRFVADLFAWVGDGLEGFGGLGVEDGAGVDDEDEVKAWDFAVFTFGEVFSGPCDGKGFAGACGVVEEDGLLIVRMRG